MIQTPEAWEVLAKATPAKPRQCQPCANGERSCQCQQPKPASLRELALPHEPEQ